MKKKIVPLILALAICNLNSCSKENEPSKEDVLHKKITDIIPQRFIDSLTKLGLPVYTETNPPNVEGSYLMYPYILKASNIPGDDPGYVFTSGKLKLFNQHSEDFGIDLIGEHFINSKDTSIVTAIAGSGNHFTVYGKVQTYNGRNTATTALLFSGIKNGMNIDSVVAGVININDSLDFDKVFIKEGQARIAYDGDYVSESIQFGSESSSFINPKKGDYLNTIGMKRLNSNK